MRVLALLVLLLPAAARAAPKATRMFVATLAKQCKPDGKCRQVVGETYHPEFKSPATGVREVRFRAIHRLGGFPASFEVTVRESALESGGSTTSMEATITNPVNAWAPVSVRMVADTAAQLRCVVIDGSGFELGNDRFFPSLHVCPDVTSDEATPEE